VPDYWLADSAQLGCHRSRINYSGIS